MIIRYQYKGKLFGDLRDIVENNRLKPSFDTIVNEYIPFQIFVTGRTLFEGVRIMPSIRFGLDSGREVPCEFNDFFLDSIHDYAKRHSLSGGNFVSAVSGGVDSSVLALILKPHMIYSGYYEGQEYDETGYSAAIARTIAAKHLKLKLTEEDFLDNLESFTGVACTPAGGFGGVMEYAALKKVLQEAKTGDVVFGNGGDEVFMGYFFNYFVKDFYNEGRRTPVYMSNFAPAKRRVAEEITDLMIVESLNKSGREVLFSDFVKLELIPAFSGFRSLEEKLLYVNINFILPSLLHLNNQICRSLNVRGHNPLSDYLLVETARSINASMTEIPKQKLREVCSNMPAAIANNYIKRGFPIPLFRWAKARKVMKELYDSFFKRPEAFRLKKEPATELNRFIWGIVQSELFLRRFG